MILSRRSALTGIGLAGLGLTGFTPALARDERIHATGHPGPPAHFRQRVILARAAAQV
jgi:hypothetical protein